MSSLGLITAKLNGLPENLRQPLLEIFTELTRNMRFGHPLLEQPDPCMNFASGFFTGTTAAIANTEFSIVHNFGRVPYLAFPILALDSVGSTTPVLTVTRAADAKRLYLSSPTTSTDIVIVAEG